MQQLRGLVTAFASMVQSLKGVAATDPSKCASFPSLFLTCLNITHRCHNPAPQAQPPLQLDAGMWRYMRMRMRIVVCTHCRMAEEAQNEATAREVVTDWRDTADGTAWAAALADIDVAIAEKRCLEALNAIKAVPDKLQLPDAGLV